MPATLFRPEFRSLGERNRLSSGQSGELGLYNQLNLLGDELSWLQPPGDVTVTHAWPATPPPAWTPANPTAIRLAPLEAGFDWAVMAVSAYSYPNYPYVLTIRPFLNDQGLFPITLSKEPS